MTDKATATIQYFRERTAFDSGNIKEFDELAIMAIAALSAEEYVYMQMIEDIRAEIETEYKRFRNMSDRFSERACGLGEALEIIDKHISGKEQA